MSSEILASQSTMVIDYFFPPQLTRKNSTGSMVVFSPDEPEEGNTNQTGLGKVSLESGKFFFLMKKSFQHELQRQFFGTAR